VRDLADDLAAFLDGLEHGADVEALTEGVFDADLDVVEVDEDGDVQSFLLKSQCDPFGPAHAGHYMCCCNQADVNGAGASGVGHNTRVNCPRCSNSRPLPPRPVISYFAVLIVCSAPRLVSTVRMSRSPLDAMKPSTLSSLPSLMSNTPLPGPDR